MGYYSGPLFLIRGLIAAPGDTWKYLEILLVVTPWRGRGYYWCPMGQGQRCCKLTYDAQISLPTANNYPAQDTSCFKAEKASLEIGRI